MDARVNRWCFSHTANHGRPCHRSRGQPVMENIHGVRALMKVGGNRSAISFAAG